MTTKIEDIRSLKDSEEYLRQVIRMNLAGELTEDETLKILGQYTAYILQYKPNKKAEFIRYAQIVEFNKHDNLN